LWDPGTLVRDLFWWESTKCSPAWWQRCFAASACEQGSWLGSIWFRVLFFFWVFLWEILLPIPMELAPSMSALYSIFVTMDCYYFILLLLLFYLFCDWFILFIYSSVRMSHRAYVAGLRTPNPIYLFWDVTLSVNEICAVWLSDSLVLWCTFKDIAEKTQLIECCTTSKLVLLILLLNDETWWNDE
jgi:hypothetical protein